MARGDQIYAYRNFLKSQGVYEHHGIDCGNGTVIHYRKPSEVIERTSLNIFARGSKIYVREYSEGFCFIPDLVIERAESRLGENKYNLLFNNCEHFATWCKTGISNSQQIKNFIPTIDKINTYNLYEPLNQALKQVDPNNAEQMLNEALANIKVVWDQIQPQYNEALKEMNIWHKVAMEAVQRNRDDLARAALERKLNYKQRATKLEKQLEQLAIMTENIIRNNQNIKHKRPS